MQKMENWKDWRDAVSQNGEGLEQKFDLGVREAILRFIKFCFKCRLWQ